MKTLTLLVLCLCLSVKTIAQSITTPPSVQLSWTNPPQNPTNTVYTVVYGTNSGQYFAGVSGTSNTSPVITNLTRGVTYYFAVVASLTNYISSTNSSELSYSVSQPQLGAVTGTTVIVIVK